MAYGVPRAAAPARFGVDAAALAQTCAMLAEAARPLVLVGGGRWTAQAARDLATFAEANGIPVVADFRCQDYIDQRSSTTSAIPGFA